ncbi:hypothetical protein, partial [Methylobacterium trifolii]|uniref:hypothetical protein n=1 Tax=Methylobacterium trifolii TaxID=1003092 RepID=UPI001EDDA3F5
MRWIYVLFLSNPAFLFCIASGIINKDYSWFILSIFMLAVSLDTLGLSCNLFSFVNGVNTVENVFKGKDNQQLTEVPFSDVRPFITGELAKGLYENNQYQSWIKSMRNITGLHGEFQKYRIYVR